jgi:hypothetical protein
MGAAVATEGVVKKA